MPYPRTPDRDDVVVAGAIDHDDVVVAGKPRVALIC